MKYSQFILAVLVATSTSGFAQQEPLPPPAKEERKRQRDQAREQQDGAREREQAVREQLESARDRAQALHDEMERDVFNGGGPRPVTAPFGGGFGGGFFEMDGGGHPMDMGLNGGRSSSPAIVALNKLDPGAQADFQEDLAVMTRILNKTTSKDSEKDQGERALGIMISTTSGRRPQSMYVEGFGAIFMLSVRFPLVPPPVKEETKPEQPTNSTWEKTKKEIFGGRDNPPADAFRGDRNEKRLEFDGDRVDQLRDDLVAAMENAANIRHLKPDECVLITVNGGGGAPGNSRTVVTNQGGKRSVTVTGRITNPGQPPANFSTMTLKAKKSDIDALAAGKMKQEDFKKQVQVLAY